MSRLRVLIDAVGIRGHGAAAVLSELLDWLPRVRPDWLWHVLMFDRSLREFDDPPVSQQVTIETTRDGDSGFARIGWVRRGLAARVRELRPDVLFSFANVAPHRAMCPQVVMCQQLNAFSSEGSPPWAVWKRARLAVMRRQILRGARASRAVIVQTAAMRERMGMFEPRLVGKTHVIPSGFRTTRANPMIRPEIAERIDHAAHPRLIYVSHPSEHKNHRALALAMADIVKAFPSAQLLLTLERENPPDARHVGFVKEIMDAAAACGVLQAIRWLGIVNADEVAYALSHCDLMVFPSLAESFGLGLAEAMAAGCPIAAANLPYAHDVAGDAAAYFDPRSPEDIARIVVRALGDSEILAQLRDAANRRKALYTYEKIADSIASVMEQSASSRTVPCNI